MPQFIEILTFVLFFIILYGIIKRFAVIEASIVITMIIIATIGEILNLVVFKTTAYICKTGIPIYIILGGVLLGWSYYKLPCLIAQKLNKNYFSFRIGIFFLISLLFPVIEICGIKLGLWYWLKPYSLSDPWW